MSKSSLVRRLGSVKPEVLLHYCVNGANFGFLIAIAFGTALLADLLLLPALLALTNADFGQRRARP